MKELWNEVLRCGIKMFYVLLILLEFVFLINENRVTNFEEEEKKKKVQI